MYFKLEDMDFNNRKVLIRLGSDVPVDENGDILDDSRIIISLPTIQYILKNNPKQIILICHVGRPKENEERYSTTKIAKRFSDLLGEEIIKLDGWSKLPDSKIVFLENLRFNPFEKSKNLEERDEFGKQLAFLADVFVQDAFSNSHHDQASMTSIPKFIPSCVGSLVEKELTIIGKAMNNPEHPLISIIGGLKAEKLNAVHNIMQKADKVLIAGALAFTVLNSMGHSMGKSKIDNEGLNKLKDLIDEIKNSDKIMLPKDAVIADNFSGDAQSKIVNIDSVPDDWMALDLGPKTIKEYIDVLKNAKTIVWNGPIGVFEFEKFAKGTRDIVNTLSNLDATVIVGGGDSAEVVHSMGNAEKMTHVSSGGGASLTLFEGKPLVAIKALEENYIKFS